MSFRLVLGAIIVPNSSTAGEREVEFPPFIEGPTVDELLVALRLRGISDRWETLGNVPSSFDAELRSARENDDDDIGIDEEPGRYGR
jgi:hypothetical protein